MESPNVEEQVDKNQRKEIKKQYKAQARQAYLSRLAESDYPTIRGLAQIELGQDLPPITKTTIETATNGLDLTEKIYLKIFERAFKSSPENKNIFTTGLESSINGFSKYLQAIYHSYQFECAISIGDIDKEFYFEGDVEEKMLADKFDQLITAYQLMKNEKMLTLIEKARSVDDYDVWQEIAKIYQPAEMDKHRLTFIKENAIEFEMK